MNKEHALLSTGEAMKSLAERLQELNKLKGSSEIGREHSWELAHHLSDIEESCSKLLTDLLPTLIQKDISDEELHKVLHAMGEEFRHLLYHIREIKYFDYLFED
jgi:hypothetical protein